MSTVYPGIHPKFDMSFFDPPQQRVLRRFSQLTHITRHGEIQLSPTSIYKYALIRPAGQMRSLLHTDREVMLVFSAYTDFQARTLDSFDRILEEITEEFRVEKVARILVSADENVLSKVKTILKNKPDAPVIIPYFYEEIELNSTDEAIAQRIREFTYSRDLFSMSSPLRSDLYFYGRGELINEICAKLSSGENFGLFGLRRSGKTSIINGIHRAIGSRSGVSVVIDCQNTAIHKRRWNELLEHIIQISKENLNINIQTSKKDQYDELNAADSFLRDMKKIKKRAKVEFIAILFDEIERISYGTSSSDHWNKDKDFLNFWQSIRFGFQSESSPFTFLIVGTNPNSIERAKIQESDNPLFGNVEKRFISMFSYSQLEEMIDDLGSIMGVRFNQDCKARLHNDFGGHPYLSRYACSFIANSVTKRPVEIDRTVYNIGVGNFSNESLSYVESVVSFLREEYEEEYEVLKILANKNYEEFNLYTEEYPRLTEHLSGYGLVKKGIENYYFSVGIVEAYFRKLGISAKLMTKENKLAELSVRRNFLESELRKLIGKVFQVSFHKNKRRDKLLTSVNSQRREGMSQISFDEILSSSSNVLYFNDLRQVIGAQWAAFENILDMQKPEFLYHMEVINKHRADAHAKDISDEEFDACRISLNAMEKALLTQFT